MSTTGRSDKPTIILIHGLWLTPRSFERWIDRFERAGYNVMAPPWPGLEGEVEELRRNPAPLKGLKLARVVDHYVKIITKLPRPPILMGHSFGGLIVQILLDGWIRMVVRERRVHFAIERNHVEPEFLQDRYGERSCGAVA